MVISKTAKERRCPNKPPTRVKEEGLPGHALAQQVFTQDQDSEGKKKRPRAKAQDLPRELRHNNQWKLLILPALFAWYSSLKNPWKIDVVVLVDSLTTICCTFIRKDYTLKREGDEIGDKSVEYKLVSFFTLSFINAAHAHN